MKNHWYSVRTTPSQTRAHGIVGYYVVLREYRTATNRFGEKFNKFLGLIHISNDLFPTRKEALDFGREEARQRSVFGPAWVSQQVEASERGIGRKS